MIQINKQHSQLNVLYSAPTPYDWNTVESDVKLNYTHTIPSSNACQLFFALLENSSDS